MITRHTYTVISRYCDRCGIPEDSFPSSVTIDGRLWHWHHRADEFRLPEIDPNSFSMVSYPKFPSFLDRVDLCPNCFHQYMQEQGKGGI